MKRLAPLVALLALAGCSAVMPQTAEAIAPATFDDFWLGVLADFESWWGWIGLIAGG